MPNYSFFSVLYLVFKFLWVFERGMHGKIDFLVYGLGLVWVLHTYIALSERVPV